MQIFVKSHLGETHALEISPNASIHELKSSISQKLCVPAGLCLTYSSSLLDDEETLFECGLEDKCTVDYFVRVSGGAKKRKKKNYTTPKKNKHKKKKVKLSVLKFYKVDDNGKITRLRRECENVECGAGVFMANHFDRQYCGRCGLTLVYKSEEK